MVVKFETQGLVKKLLENVVKYIRLYHVKLLLSK